jgi:hypothetical protein
MTRAAHRRRDATDVIQTVTWMKAKLEKRSVDDGRISDDEHHRILLIIAIAKQLHHPV